MIRLIVIAVLVVAVWYAALQAYRFLRDRPIDWTGLAFAAAFIILAFYLRSISGIGG
jgi:predicted permease